MDYILYNNFASSSRLVCLAMNLRTVVAGASLEDGMLGAESRGKLLSVILLAVKRTSLKRACIYLAAKFSHCSFLISYHDR